MIKTIFTIAIFTINLCVINAQGKIEDIPERKFTTINNLFESTNFYDSDIAGISTNPYFIRVNLDRLNQILLKRYDHFKISFTRGNKEYTLKLVKNKILSDNFKIYNKKGKALNYSKALHYKGIVEGETHSIAALSFYDGKLRGLISTSNDGNLIIDKLTNHENIYLSYLDKNLLEKPGFNCSYTNLSPDKNNVTNSINCNPSQLNKCLRVYYEIGYDIYQANGLSVQNTVNWISSVHNVVNVLYEDNNLRTAIGEIVIWQQNDPYNAGNTEDNLEIFKQETPLFNGDVGHLIKSSGGSGGNGGRAFLDSLCTLNNYAVSNVNFFYNDFPLYSWTIQLISHELGHSMGSPHTHACFWNGNDTAIDSCGPVSGYSEGCDNAPIPDNGGTIMSYCHLNSTGINFSIGFHPQVETFLANNLQFKDCLGNNCIDDTMLIATDFFLNQPDLNTLNVTINDTIFNSWDYRLYDTSIGPLGGFTTVSSHNISFNDIVENRYYRFELATNCIDDDGFNSYKYFQNREFLSDADWCAPLKYFTDSGGLNDSYKENNEIIKTFYPSSDNEILTMTFLSFHTFQQDVLNVYDGTSMQSPLFNNGSLSGNYTSQPTFTATNPEGAITVHFKSYDSSAQTPSGWQADFTCETMSNESFQRYEVKIYPNPVHQNLHINSHHIIDDIAIYDISGKLIKRYQIEKKKSFDVDLTNLSSGMYLISIKGENKSTVKSFFKK